MMNVIFVKSILEKINIGISFDGAEITPFKNAEDGAEYEAWRVTAEKAKYVLKKAKNRELQVYSTFFSDNLSGVPRFYGSVCDDGTDYFLMEYVCGDDMRRCDRDSLINALDALISLQDEFWEYPADSFFSDSLKNRINRGKYLGDALLEKVYADFLVAFESVPKTLCHDDLLPFNVLVSEKGATIIDWEIAGILPYLVSLARLIAHAEESDDAFFYMRDEDKAFAIDYYFENLVKKKGISYEEYRNTLYLFLLYEYCEWIMLGNKYPDADMERFNRYLAKAKEHIKE